MSRPYTLKRRAEQQADTRRRIVEAAVELHSTVGPALTTVSMVAERAGVQRHTYYSHFPDEWSLYLACSGLAMERDPLPDARGWRSIEDAEERLRAGLGALYGWYQRNASLAGCVLRDVETHKPTRDIAALRFGPPIAACAEVLGEKLEPGQRVLLPLALSFYSWRTLTREAGMDCRAAVAAMVKMIAAAGT
jgi:AcrR family transcriptional regulator